MIPTLIQTPSTKRFNLWPVKSASPDHAIVNPYFIPSVKIEIPSGNVGWFGLSNDCALSITWPLTVTFDDWPNDVAAKADSLPSASTADKYARYSPADTLSNITFDLVIPSTYTRL